MLEAGNGLRRSHPNVERSCIALTIADRVQSELIAARAKGPIAAVPHPVRRPSRIRRFSKHLIGDCFVKIELRRHLAPAPVPKIAPDFEVDVDCPAPVP